MAEPPVTCPLSRRQVIDRYFLEHRAKLLDLAAFLDRVDRAKREDNGEPDDFRLATMRDAIAILLDGESERARRVLELMSDPTSQPIEKAGGKGATGAWPGYFQLTPGV